MRQTFLNLRELSTPPGMMQLCVCGGGGGTDHKLIPCIEDGINTSIHCHLVAQVSGLGIWKLNTGNGKELGRIKN